MQRTMKKAFSFVLALALVLTMGVGMFATQAQAADANTLVMAEETEGYEFSAYQIFSGTYTKTEAGDTLSDIDWGSGIDTSKLSGIASDLSRVLGVTIDSETIATQAGAQAVAEALGGVEDYSSTAAQVAALLGQCLQEGTGTSMTYGVYGQDETTREDLYGYSASGLADGYYLIKTEAVPTTEGDETGAYTEYILALVGGDETIIVDEKEDIPHSNKTVGDVNDSDPSNEDPNYNIDADQGSSGDYDIGDDVPFVLTGTVSTYYKDFDSYNTIFHDTMTDGLTFNDDVSVYIVVDGTDYEVNLATYAGYVSVTTSVADSCTFEVSFTNFAGLLDAMAQDPLTAGVAGFDPASDSIKITFTAKLNESALIGNLTATDSDTTNGYYGSGSYGNMNKSHLDYSNNVYDGTEYGKTPDVEVRVYTYGFIVNKVDQTGTALEGAEFSLQKFVASEDGTYSLTIGSESVRGEWVDVTEDASVDGSTFTWTGIDDGYYRVSETETPAGYNSIDDFYFIVVASHDTLATSLTVYDGTFTETSATSGTLVIGSEQSDTIEISQESGYTGGGWLDTEVENKAGSVLPSTGGIGTYIFYIIGGAIVVCAVVVLVTRRRMRRAA